MGYNRSIGESNRNKLLAKFRKLFLPFLFSVLFPVLRSFSATLLRQTLASAHRHRFCEFRKRLMCHHRTVHHPEGKTFTRTHCDLVVVWCCIFGSALRCFLSCALCEHSIFCVELSEFDVISHLPGCLQCNITAL